jgi:hypothetical protein
VGKNGEMILKSYMEIRGFAKPKTNGGRKEHQNGEKEKKRIYKVVTMG